MSNKLLLRGLLVCPPILALLFADTGCDRSGSAAPPAGGGFAAPVVAIPAASGDVPVYLDEIGKAVASQVVTVNPQVSGPILKRDFEDGADLKKGQLLFEIDPRPFQAQLDQANGQLAKDTAQRASADWNVQQDQAAMQTRAISEQQLHNDIGTRDQAIGAIAVDNAQIEQANLNLEYCKIKSPIDGRAGLRLVDAGNVVTAAGQAPGTNLLSIQTLDPIYADFTITEAELLKVQQYMASGSLSVQVMLPQDATVAAGAMPATQPTPAPGAEFSTQSQHPAVVGLPLAPDRADGATPATMPAVPVAALPVPRIGKLTFLDNAVQDGTGTIKLRATIPNSDHHFWPGQFLTVRLVLMVQKDAVLIPSSATQISQKGPYVYTVQPDSTALLSPITLGQRQGDMVVVTEGLHAGDQIILSGQLMVMDKGKVMVVNRPQAGGPAAPNGGAK